MQIAGDAPSKNVFGEAAKDVRGGGLSEVVAEFSRKVLFRGEGWAFRGSVMWCSLEKYCSRGALGVMEAGAVAGEFFLG